MNNYFAESGEKYKKFLDEQIEEAAKNFEQAKLKAIIELQNMTIWAASEYGAGYAAHIEYITKYASQVKELSYAWRVYNDMFENAKKQDEVSRIPLPNNE